MTFTKRNANLTPIVDTVFAVASKAKASKATDPEGTVDATVGTLCDEDGKLVAFKSVFDHYDAIDPRVKAAYASSFSGNPIFKEAAYNWVIANQKVDLPYRVIATPGGTGAVNMGIHTFLDEGQTLLVPEIAWGSYKLMAEENHLALKTYPLFSENSFDIESFKKIVHEIADQQDKVVCVINDPCHNPTGYSMTLDEWKEVLTLFNEISRSHPVVVINDIAYIDYSSDLAHSRDYLTLLNDLSDNVLFEIAFSCSKTVTSYGLRCGAAIILSKKEESVREAEIYMEKYARAVWSNIANAAMENFAWVVNENRDAFLKEKQDYIDLMNKRSSLFIQQADEVGLKYYPYKEGFFVTIVCPDAEKAAYHERLLDNKIFTVQVKDGIRIAVCSLPMNKIDGLAKKLKELM